MYLRTLSRGRAVDLWHDKVACKGGIVALWRDEAVRRAQIRSIVAKASDDWAILHLLGLILHLLGLILHLLGLILHLLGLIFHKCVL